MPSVIDLDALKGQKPLPGFEIDELTLQGAKTNLWYRMLLGEKGYEIVCKYLDREPDGLELFHFVQGYKTIGYNPDRFSEYLAQRDLEKTIFYRLPDHVAQKYGYPKKSSVRIPFGWRVLTGMGEENAGVVYMGDDPFEAMRQQS